MINNNPKPYRPKQDRYEKFNKSSMILRESSFMSSSVETSVTLNDMIRDQPRQCRICLHDEDPYGGKQLYSVCKCTGSVKYLHEQCFLSWVNKSFEQKTPQQRKKILQHGSQCQLCKFLIPIQSNFVTQCSSLNHIKNRINKRPFLFTIFTVIEILCFVVVAFVISQMATLEMGFGSDKIVNSMILICSLIVLLCLTLGVGYSYVMDYFMDEKVVAIGFGQGVKERSSSLQYFSKNSCISPGVNSFTKLRDSQLKKSPEQNKQQTNQNHQNSIRIIPIEQQPHQNVIYVMGSMQQLQS